MSDRGIFNCCQCGEEYPTNKRKSVDYGIDLYGTETDELYETCVNCFQEKMIIEQPNESEVHLDELPF